MRRPQYFYQWRFGMQIRRQREILEAMPRDGDGTATLREVFLAWVGQVRSAASVGRTVSCRARLAARLTRTRCVAPDTPSKV